MMLRSIASTMQNLLRPPRKLVGAKTHNQAILNLSSSAKSSSLSTARNATALQQKVGRKRQAFAPTKCNRQRQAPCSG